MEIMSNQLDNNRKPRVQITYDVEVNNAKIKKELPFVVGIIGNFSGDNQNLSPLKDREFLEINKDNFNNIMQKIAPEINISINNVIDKNIPKKMNVNLKFNSLEDFHPSKVAYQIPILKKLLDARQVLLETLSKVESSENFESSLEEYFNKNQ